MANFSKIAPVGLDVSVEAIKDLVYGLKDYWNVDLDGYGRCYPSFNKDNNRKEIEFYTGNNESKNVVYAEQNKFFFTAEYNIDRVGNGFAKTKVDLYFIVNTKQIYPNIPHRADEEVRLDVWRLLEQSSKVSGFNVVVDIDKVFNKYDYDYRDDLHPYHCFKYEIELTEYDVNQTC